MSFLVSSSNYDYSKKAIDYDYHMSVGDRLKAEYVRITVALGGSLSTRTTYL